MYTISVNIFVRSTINKKYYKLQFPSTFIAYVLKEFCLSQLIRATYLLKLIYE